MFIEKWILLTIGAIIVVLVYLLVQAKKTIQLNWLASQGEVIRLWNTAGMYRNTLKELQKHVDESIYIENGLMQYDEAISFSPLFGERMRNEYLVFKVFTEKDRLRVQSTSEKLYETQYTDGKRT